MRFQKATFACIFSLLILAITACSSSPEMPSTLLDQTEQNQHFAKQIGAEKHASVIYSEGKSNLEKAREAIDEEEYSEAKNYLERASADFQLASAKTQAVKSKDTVDKLDDTLNVLEESL